MVERGTGYRDDALYWSEDVTIDEVIDYLRTCVENPRTIHGKAVWNFSTHKIDHDGMQTVAGKDQDQFVVPYQVGSAWAFMFHLLPEHIRRAETLVYSTSDEQYYAYRSMYRTTQTERQDQIRQDLSKRLESECGNLIGLPEATDG